MCPRDVENDFNNICCIQHMFNSLYYLTSLLFLGCVRNAFFICCWKPGYHGLFYFKGVYQAFLIFFKKIKISINIQCQLVLLNSHYISLWYTHRLYFWNRLLWLLIFNCQLNLINLKGKTYHSDRMQNTHKIQYFK